MAEVLYSLGLFGIVAFAVTGVIAAGKRDMDILSIVVLGVVTALGGGTLRDIILDTHPIFWIRDLTYFWVATAASLLTFFFIRTVSRLLQIFTYIDAFGMALFTILAMETTLEMGYGSTIAILMGLVTGITGGMIRDILTARMPLVLGREFYATPALIGAGLYGFLNTAFPDHYLNWLYGITTIFILRVAAIRWGLYYPKWLTYKDQGQL